MSSNVTISCILNTNNPGSDLGFEAWVDDTKFIDIDHVTAQQPISIEIPYDAGEHELRFVLKNKKEKHTQIDENHNIIADSTLTIYDLAFDEIKLGYIVTQLAVYTHDFNGTGEESQHKFYGELGCNGTVSLKFSIPIYLWLLEHM
jgi:hypothetical protein